MSKTKMLLAKYVDTASTLAESVKRNISHGKKHNGDIVAVIDDATVLALNEFIIASNEIKDLTDQLTLANNKIN